MSEQELQRLEELLFRAVQTGKKETSDLVTDVLSRLDPAIQQGIEKHVNGKIRAIDKKIDDYIQHDMEYNSRIEKETMTWRASADSKLKIVSDWEAFGTISSKILGLVIMLGTASGAIFGIMKLFDWVKGK